jgi:hypothetical protein
VREAARDKKVQHFKAIGPGKIPVKVIWLHPANGFHALGQDFLVNFFDQYPIFGRRESGLVGHIDLAVKFFPVLGIVVPLAARWSARCVD